jgi:hypothetical protein
MTVLLIMVVILGVAGITGTVAAVWRDGYRRVPRR